MLDATTDASTTHDPLAIPDNPEGALPTLFRHSLRHQWGLGVVLRRLDDRVDLQFQDGRARTFKQGFYHLFEPVDRRFDVASGIVEALMNMSGAGTRRAPKARPVTLEEQVAYFRELYPDGFRGDAYTEERRGDGRKRPLKRHRDALVANAREKLAKRALADALAAGDATAVHAAAGEVISGTDLVKVKERKRFLAMDAGLHAPVANAIHALLHGQSPLTGRLDALVAWLERALGEAPSWELATVLLGAMRPEEHFVMREPVIARQAVFMAPGLSVPQRPMGILYERLRAMAEEVQQHLVEEDLAPRDMLDVHNFMWLTLKPAAQRQIRERRRDLDNPLVSASEPEETATTEAQDAEKEAA